LAEGTIEDRVGKTGLKQIGRKIWEKDVERILTQLQRAFVVDYIVLGGGNAKLLEQLPPSVELGHNRNAYLGGQRVWENHARARFANCRDRGRASRDRIKNRHRFGPRVQRRTIAPPAWQGRLRLHHGGWSRARVFRSDQGPHRRRSEVIEGRRSAAGGKSRVYLRQIALAFPAEIFESRAVAQPSCPPQDGLAGARLWGQPRKLSGLHVPGHSIGAA